MLKPLEKTLIIIHFILLGCGYNCHKKCMENVPKNCGIDEMSQLNARCNTEALLPANFAASWMSALIWNSLLRNGLPTGSEDGQPF